MKHETGPPRVQSAGERRPGPGPDQAIRITNPVGVASLTAIGLCVAYVLAPKMGGDLSAQIAHADFARQHPLSPVDFRWFGGTLPFGYSLWTPPVMALVGVRITGALATVAAVALFTYLLTRTGARRPLWGGLGAAVTLTSNLAEGRVTFACGLALGLAALAALPVLHHEQDTEHQNRSVARHILSAGCSVLAGAASPVAALLLLLCAGVLLLRRRLLDASVLAAGMIPVVIISGLFSDSGHQVFGTNDAVRAALATGLLIVLVPARPPALRIGGVLGLALVLLAFLLATPVGSNSARLSLLFAVPLAAAFVQFDWWLSLLAVALVVVVQSPVTFGTLTGAGQPVTRASYFAPLAAELDRLGPLTGRVEVPELTGHWDAAYLARSTPLARGWLRQTDTKLNDEVFYRHPPTASTYRTFLDRSAVQYVAVADARPTYYGRREATLIAAGLPYLRRVWSNAHWTLYAIDGAVPIVEAPGELVSYRADRIVLRAPAEAAVTVHIRWFRWLTVDAGCLADDGHQVVLHTGAVAGTYTISSHLGSGTTC